MKSYHYFLLVSVLLLNCEVNDSVEYYRKVKLDGRDAIVGNYPVLPEKSTKVSCYRFIYDDIGRLSRLEYLRCGRPRRDDFFNAAKVIIEYTDSTEKRIFFDVYGQPTPVEEKVYSHLIGLDSDGFKKSLTFLNRHGKLTVNADSVASKHWEVDRDGRITKETSYSMKNNQVEFGDIHEERYEYENSNWPIKKAFFSNDGRQQNDLNGIASIESVPDDYGNVLVKRAYDLNGSLISRGNNMPAVVRMEYDSLGNLLSIKSYDNNEKPISFNGLFAWEINYDFAGNEIESRTYDEYMRLVNCSDGFAIMKNVYDSVGSNIELGLYDTEDKLTEIPDFGIAIFRFKYDDYGNQIESRRYNKHNHLTGGKNDDIALYRFKYSDIGQLTEKSWFDINEGLIEDQDGVAYQRYYYDSFGDKIKTVFYDKNGKIVDEEPKNVIAKDEAIIITADWSESEQKIIEITKFKERISGTDTTLSGQVKMDIGFSVVGSDNAGYLINWAYDTLYIDETEYKENDPGIQLINIIKDIKIDYRTDIYGSFDSLASWLETREYLLAVVDQILASKDDSAEVTKFMAMMDDLTDSRAMTENLFTKEIQVYHGAYGLVLTPNEVIEAEVTIPNPLDNSPIPGVISVEAQWLSGNAAKVSAIATIDKDKCGQIIWDSFKTLFKRNNLDVTDFPEDFDQSMIDVVDSTVYIFDMQTGWPDSISYKRHVVISEGRQSDFWYMKLKD